MATLKDLLASGMSRDEINAILSQSIISTDGFQGNPQPDYRDALDLGAISTGGGLPPQQQTMAQFFANPQPEQLVQQPEAPRFTVGDDGLSRMTDRPGVSDQSPMNSIRNNTTGVVTQMPTSRQGRSHDVWADGPEVLHRQLMPDGRTLVTERVPAMSDGRQSVGIRQRIETPDYLNPAMIQKQKYENGAAELAQMQMQKQRQELETGNVEQQIKRAQLSELMGIDPAAQAGSFGGGATPLMPSAQSGVANQKMLSRRFGNPPAGHRWDAQGNAIPIPGVEKPLTEFQGKSAGYGARAAVAHEVLNSIGQDGKVQPGLIKRVLESTPFIGEGLGTLANVTQSPEQQQIEQSQRDFVNAVLRQESGAAISEGEFNNAKKQYFPQPGDTPEVIAQKARNREQAIAGFSTSAGNDGVKLIKNSREAAQTLFEAKKAIAKGADREKVKQRLEAMGINHSGI